MPLDPTTCLVFHIIVRESQDILIIPELVGWPTKTLDMECLSTRYLLRESARYQRTVYCC